MATEKDKKDKKDKKEKKGVGILRYLKEMQGELKKLTWPTKKELIANTATVLAFVLIIAAIIGVLDLVFGWGLGLLTSL